MKEAYKKFFNVFIFLLSVGGLCFFLSYILQIDSLASYRNHEDKNARRITVELDDALICTYKNDFMTSRLEVGCVQVTKERDQLLLHSVRNGAVYSRNSMVGFSARKGTWYRNDKRLVAHQGVRIKNNDMDFVADSIEYDERTKNLTVPGKVRGHFFKGDLIAEKLRYHSEQKTFEIGSTEWTGKAEDFQETKKEHFHKPQLLPAPKVELPSSKLVNPISSNKDEVKRKNWTIKAKSGSRPPGDIEVWNQAEATDGEIILIANRIERNIKTNILIATDNVRYYGEEVNMTCKKATLYRAEKRALLEGNVNIYIKPKEDSKLEVVELEPLRPVVPEDILNQRPASPKKGSLEKKLDDEVHSTKSKRKYPITVISQSIEYWYRKGERRAEITGNPQGRQELAEGRWRQIWAYSAHFDKEKERLKLNSRLNRKEVRVKTSLGDNLFATWFETSTDEKKESWEGEGIEGDVMVDQGES